MEKEDNKPHDRDAFPGIPAPSADAELKLLLLAIASASFRGVLEILDLLARRGLLDRSDLGRIHASVAAAVDASGADRPAFHLSIAQDVADTAFADILKTLQLRTLSDS